MSAIKLIPKEDSPCTLGVIGSVNDVIAGVVDPMLAKRRFLAKDYRFGFEIGSPHSLQSLGEAILVNKLLFATSTDKNNNYLKTISGESFYTTGLFVVPHEAKPNYDLQPSNAPLGLNYYTFWRDIYQQIKKPVLFAALMRFKPLSATYIQAPPIQKENIFTHKDKYYGSQPPLAVQDCYSFIVGVLAHLKQDDPEIVDKLKVVIYQNPFDLKDELTIHTHGIVLNNLVPNYAAITPHNVAQTVHLLNADTLIQEVIWGELYTVGDIQDLSGIK
jgi:hypothetical protein